MKLKNGSKLTIEGHTFVLLSPEELKKFDLWVACALELSPFKLSVEETLTLHCALDDVSPMRPEDLRKAIIVSGFVADVLRHKGKVLVTCAMGLNRSSLVAGLTLRRMGYSAKDVLDMIREERGPAALFNRDFLAAIRKARFKR